MSERGISEGHAASAQHEIPTLDVLRSDMAMGLASSYVENLGEADYDSLVDMGHHVLGCLKAMLDNGSAPSR